MEMHYLGPLALSGTTVLHRSELLRYHRTNSSRIVEIHLLEVRALRGITKPD
jgi:hypothetical protein